MGFQIKALPGGQVFAAEPGEAILDAALRHGLTLPYGCRDGACGACRGQVLSGEVDYGRAQFSTLSKADRDAGFALFCCASARSDLVIASREVRSGRELQIKTLPARIEKLERLAPDVMLIELKLPASERLQFLPGQYIDVLLRGGRRRTFSLANAPHDDALLQLHVRHNPGGVFTDQVFGSMKARDLLRIRGPYGDFFLREDSVKPMLLVAGGTGFAPIKSIVEHAIAENSDRPMHVYWGGRRRVDLYLRETAESWAQTRASLRFVPVLSEAQADDRWDGRTGLVHVAAMADLPDLSGYQAYVCGSPEMVAATRRDFVGQCGLPDDEFFADSFESANDSAPTTPPTPPTTD
ncbi:MAG: CDP-6-deoxy-delta-3,4-glucoseen reductase [Propionivibrio sp.]